MLKKAAIILSALTFGSFILITSLLRTTVPEYAFSGETPGVLGTQYEEDQETKVEYHLPYPGMLPDHFLWPVKAARDRVWLFLTSAPNKRADLLLLFADKHVGMARELVRGGKAELGVSIAQKAEMYLADSARETEKIDEKKADLDDILIRIKKAAIKHEEVLLETQMYAPDDAKPKFSEIMTTTKMVSEKIEQKLNERNLPIPGETEQEIKDTEE